jgi:hypothetical protein
VKGREWARREERAVVGSKGDVGQLGGGEPSALPPAEVGGRRVLSSVVGRGSSQCFMAI